MNNNITPEIGKIVRGKINGAILQIVDIQNQKTINGNEPYVVLMDYQSNRKSYIALNNFKNYHFEEV